MTADSNAPHGDRLEQLLEHADWITALARRLVRGPATADDLVQDTWSAALEHPEAIPPRAAARPWLATVLKNRLRSLRRGEGRRLARERAVAPEEALPPESELVERLERQRALARRVLELAEPYRSTLEGLSFPIGSVHTPAARTGPDGSFVLHGVPHVPGARLLVAPEREQLPPLVHLLLEETGPTAELRVPRPVEVELRGRGQGALTIDAEGWPLNPEIEPALAALRAEDAPAFGDLIDGAARLWLAPGSYHFLSSVDGERHDVTGPVEVAGPGPVRVALP